MQSQVKKFPVSPYMTCHYDLVSVLFHSPIFLLFCSSIWSRAIFANLGFLKVKKNHLQNNDKYLGRYHASSSSQTDVLYAKARNDSRQVRILISLNSWLEKNKAEYLILIWNKYTIESQFAVSKLSTSNDTYDWKQYLFLTSLRAVVQTEPFLGVLRFWVYCTFIGLKAVSP